MVSLYYRFIKPILPRPFQIFLRRLRAKRIFSDIEPPYTVAHQGITGFKWPEGSEVGVLLTHDVETSRGFDQIKGMLEVEREHEVESCWNFVAGKYAIPEGIIDEIRALGHEIGVHGIKHDGKLFSSYETFNVRLKEMKRFAFLNGIHGFRSPSMLYNSNMMRSLDFSWDSSMPAWDPFQPQQGGCRSYFPFMLNQNCVELPVTLWQDFTVFEELQMDGIDVWINQISYISEIGGLINVITHPDYMNSSRLRHYSELVSHIKKNCNAWITTPNVMADWVRSTLAAR